MPISVKPIYVRHIAGFDTSIFAVIFSIIAGQQCKDSPQHLVSESNLKFIAQDQKRVNNYFSYFRIRSIIPIIVRKWMDMKMIR